MPGSLLTLLTPTTPLTVLHVLYGYIFPITLHCVWATLVLLDLAQSETRSRRQALGWCALVFLVPFAGSAAYLLSQRGALSRVTRTAVLAGGLLIVVATYVASYALIG
jgi:hypothetical protein